jgi:hypothetical protein
MVEDKFKRSNVPFGKEFKFPSKFELKFRKENIFEISLNLKGFKPFGKNSINSPKFFLNMIFNTVKLD